MSIQILLYIYTATTSVRIVRKPWWWRWSSARVHAGQEGGGINLENITTLINTTAEEWKEQIGLDENEEEAEDIRKHTSLGLPSGTKEVIAKSGKRTGRGYWHVDLFEDIFEVWNYVFCYLWLAF